MPLNSRSNRRNRTARPTDYILAGPTSTPSARVLRDAIERLSGRRYLITHKSGFAQNAIVRYGGDATVTGRDTQYNSVSMISILGNKRRFASILAAAGLNVPEFHNSGEPSSFPCLIRETLSGFGGAGIHVIHDITEFRSTWRNGYWWVPFYNMDSEYRVHVIDGQILRVFEKVPTSDLGPTPIRNNASCHFSLVERPRCGESIRKAVTAICALPEFSHGFFALDVGWMAREKRLIIIEGNSAPGLNDNTAEMYARVILGMPLERPAVAEVVAAAEAAPVTRPATPADAPRPRPVTRTENPTQAVSREMRGEVQRVLDQERGGANAEVLRTTSNSGGTQTAGAGNQSRTEHQPAVRRPQWEW